VIFLNSSYLSDIAIFIFPSVLLIALVLRVILVLDYLPRTALGAMPIFVESLYKIKMKGWEMLCVDRLKFLL
jgi:hypothetical protein